MGFDASSQILFISRRLIDGTSFKCNGGRSNYRAVALGRPIGLNVGYKIKSSTVISETLSTPVSSILVNSSMNMNTVPLSSIT